MIKKTILFMSHFVNDILVERYQKLVNEAPSDYDVYWMLQYENNSEEKLPDNIKFETFTLKNIDDLGYYIYGNHLYHNVNFIPQLFYNRHPEYEYYWNIEYDVIYTGDWSIILKSFEKSNSDMIACHVEKYSEKNADWSWWRDFDLNEQRFRKQDCLKSFNPIYRMSNRAFVYLDQQFKIANPAYFETTIPTLLYNNNFILEDFGGTGEFVHKNNYNRFYIQGADVNNGTMRFLPRFLDEEISYLGTKNILFHPVK